MLITFAINRYDSDGDIYDRGIFLNLNDKLIIKVKDIEEIEDMINWLKMVIKEIKENGGE